LPVTNINEGCTADLTLFRRDTDFTITKDEIKSKSHNSPFLNVQLKGKVIGVINKEKVYLNP
jgi:dihydroorotase